MIQKAAMLLSCLLLFAFPLFVSALSPPIPDTCVERDYRLGDEYVVEVCKKYAVNGNHKEWTNVKACLTPQKKRIPIGESVTENGLNYSCVKNGHKAKLVKKEVKTIPIRAIREASIKFTLCKDQYENGERVIIGNFVKVCAVTPDSWTLTVVSCIGLKKKEIPIGESVLEELGMTKWKCVKTENGAKIEVEHLWDDEEDQEGDVSNFVHHP